MRKFINIFLFVVMIFFLSQKGRAQRFNFSLEQFTTDNGLSHESVLTITKDKDGFMWIGTANGLNRFDGLSFKIFRNDPDQLQTIPANYIAGTTLDKKGFLWVATNNGLCRMDTRSLEIDRIDLRAPGDRFSRYEVMYGEFDTNGTGWYLINDFLYAINQETLKWKRYPLPATRFHGNSSQIDSKNRIWLAIGRARYLFDPTTEKFRYLMGFDWSHRDSDILCGWMKEDEKGRLWMSTWAHGFYAWNENRKEFDKIGTQPESITNFEFDKNEQGDSFLWCGGGAYGLMAYDPAENKFYQFKNDPKDKYSHNLGQATFILRDTSTGIVWIGTENGLEKYDPHAIRFRRYRIWQDKSEYANSQYFFTSGFVQDKTDTTGNTWWVSVWIGGLYKWNRNKLKLDEDYVAATGIKEAGIFSILQAKDGMIWIGHGLGVQVLDPRKNKFIRHYVNFFPDQKARRSVTFISEDSKSNMWFSTYQGLFSWERKGDSIVNWWNRIPSMHKIYPLNIREDAEGYIWFSSGKGVGRIDPQKNELILFNNANRKKTRLPDDEIGVLYIDRVQHIWVSGVGFVAELDKHGEVVKIYDNKSGFIATSAFNLTQDPSGFIWIATDYKLHRLNPATGQFDYFDKNDGLFNNKMGDGFYMSDKGELFIGFNGAMNSINTSNIAFNKKPPAVLVSRLNIKGQPRSFDGNNKVVVKPGERNIQIEFSALNYSQASKNSFAFWLEGYDSTWRYTNERTISLMNMEGGTHPLHVKASNNDGVWSRETIYAIKVIPPFQQTIWFKLLFVVLAGVLFFIFYAYKKQHRRRLEKIRDRIATDLHDDMGSTLSSIRIFSDVAKKQIEEKPETVQLLDRISNNATSLSENMQDIIWTIRSDNDTLEDLVSRMREFGLRVCDAKNIRFNTTVSQSFKASKLTLEQRRNLYLIFKEALNNAVKYSQCTQIDLILNLKNRFLKLELADNGKGFNIEEIKRGNGLNNLEKRAKEINGQIDIKSAPGKGTCINLMVILKKSLLIEK
ncbi:MAG TPA: two-component regulator propeller domain-containing protein [Chitinophagaceae bacterium]